MEKGGWVYILTNKYHTVLYTGVTSDLRQRTYDHQNGTYPGSFTSRYKAAKLVYYYFYDSIEDAINEEKRIKAGSRQKKILLINQMNLSWRDLTPDIQD
ncbi:putative endonuclease [Pedobacter africanus]|uniref:Endonuclease n=1 Tax=Pedobacter africanus TaxID=151894 RepID=A0ACC6KWN8_9SPHI|nr:GIY-YIG nuclease family protein [Pedobacter africanus]MDR6783790.1 putative endonuclease [Pedobacter africanus]